LIVIYSLEDLSTQNNFFEDLQMFTDSFGRSGQLRQGGFELSFLFGPAARFLQADIRSISQIVLSFESPECVQIPSC
jgi:hypothetical protein